MNLAALFRPHQRWRRSIDAYADGELAPATARKFEAHLGRCAACAADVEAARSLRLLMSETPPVAVPRSFRLTPAMLDAPRRPAPERVSPRAGFVMRASQALAGVAVLAFAVLVVVDVSGSGSGGDDAANTMGAAAADSAPAPQESSLAEDADDGAPVPEASPGPAFYEAPPAGDGEPAEAMRSGDAFDAKQLDYGEDGDGDGGISTVRVAQVGAAVLAIIAAGAYIGFRRAAKERAS